MIRGLDHVNLRTARLDEMVRWYGEILGLAEGWRPGFGFPGAWLYAGDSPVVHLVGVAEPTEAPRPGVQLEHAAFAASGYGAFVAMLDARGERYKTTQLTDVGVVQVNVWDPDGNHLHIDFPLAEMAD